MKVVIGNKDGKSYQRELEKAKEGSLLGKHIGESFDGGIVGAEGYELQITGGSDKNGFPMRPEVTGSRRMKVVLARGPGVRGLGKGQAKKRNIFGNTVSADVAQVNAKVAKAGAKKLEELGFVLTPKEKKAEDKKPAAKGKAKKK